MLRTRYSLRIDAVTDIQCPSICIDDLARNTVLFHWHGPEARCLLESHDILRQNATQHRSSERCVSISKTSVWHLALHAAAIRCLLNRCNEEISARSDPAGDAGEGARGGDAQYCSLYRMVMNILQAGDDRQLSAQDITCLLALDGKNYPPRIVTLVLDDLSRWRAIRCCRDDRGEVFYGVNPETAGNADRFRLPAAQTTPRAVPGRFIAGQA